MNVAAADPASWRSVAAYVAAPVFLAVITDRVIAVIRQHILPLDIESAWAPLGRIAVAGLRLAAVVALYLLRTMLAPSGTLRGLRQMVLDAAPVPGMTGAASVRRRSGARTVTRMGIRAPPGLAQTVGDALDAAAPRRLAAPCWIGLDRQACATQLAELRQWADTVLRRHYGGYELRDCWPSHIHAVWELSTLALCMAQHLRRRTPRPGPRPGVPRPLASRHHAPHRPHHSDMHTAVRHFPPFLVTGRLSTSALWLPVVSCYATLVISTQPSMGLPTAAMGDR